MGQIKNDDLPTALYTISPSDISKHTGRRVRNEHFKEAIERLQKRLFRLKGEGGVLQTSFISSAFFDDRGFVTIALNSIYSKRLYEMLCQFRSTGVLLITLSELKERFCLIKQDGSEKFDRWISFETTVLKMAQKEINEKADFTVDYKLKKSNRKVVGIDFTIIKKEKALPPVKEIPIALSVVIEKQEVKDPRFDRTVERLTNYGLTKQQVNSVFKKHEINRIVKVLFDADCNRDKIVNSSAFLLKVFEI